MIGGINIAFEIFDDAVLPLILHNCETWLDMSKKTRNLLDKFHNSSFQCILQCSKGAPKADYYWQTGSIQMDNIILQKQLTFCYNLAIWLEKSSK